MGCNWLIELVIKKFVCFNNAEIKMLTSFLNLDRDFVCVKVCILANVLKTLDGCGLAMSVTHEQVFVSVHDAATHAERTVQAKTKRNDDYYQSYQDMPGYPGYDSLAFWPIIFLCIIDTEKARFKKLRQHVAFFRIDFLEMFICTCHGVLFRTKLLAKFVKFAKTVSLFSRNSLVI